MAALGDNDAPKAALILAPGTGHSSEAFELYPPRDCEIEPSQTKLPLASGGYAFLRERGLALAGGITRFTGDRPVAAAGLALADRRELALVAIERARMPMVVSDPNQAGNPIILANQAFLNLTGYSAEQILGKNCRFLQGEKTSPAAIAEIREAVMNGKEIEIEILNFRADGSEFWNQLHISPIYDSGDSLQYFFASQADITVRRLVEELQAAEQRLLKEIDHRALNVLAIVEGIVRLTRASDTAGFISAVHRRVQALAGAHTMLSERKWAGVPLAPLLRAQLDAHRLGRHVELEGPDVWIVAPLAQSLALVFHELTSNAAAHGSLASPTGTLQIRWSKSPASDGLVLSWEETGGDPPKPNREVGFGSKILTSIVRRQLRGAWEENWAADGLKAYMEVPACLTHAVVAR